MEYNSEILLRRKNSIVLPDAPGRTNVGIIAAANLNLQELGYTLSAQAINRLKNTYPANTVETMRQVLSFAAAARGEGAGLARPMYPNFPAQVVEAAEAELYLNAILHYFSVWIADITYNEDYVWLPKYRKTPRSPLGPGDKVKLTVLKVVSEDKTGPLYREILRQLVTSNTSISEQDKTDIRLLVNVGGYLPSTDTEIPNKENLAIYAAAMLNHKDPINQKWFQHGTDVLRLATALSDGDVSLAENTKFKSFSRPVRRALLDLLAKDQNLQEAFARDRERFIRLGERLHPREFKDARYRKLRHNFQILRANLRLETFNSRVEELLLKKNAIAATAQLITRPGEFARRLDHLLQLAQTNHQGADAIVRSFGSVTEAISTPVLLQLATHFENRNKTNVRVIMPKGEVAKIQLLDEGPRSPINAQYTEQIVTACRQALATRFSKLSNLGKVYVDPELKNYLVPFSQRSASAALRTITRGSQVPFSGEKDTLRFFVHWKNTSKGVESHSDYYDNGRVDLDLSANMYDADWNDKGRVWYGNLRGLDYTGRGTDFRYKAYHSGDITSAPNGAAEFIDVDIPSVLQYGGRYLVATVNMFAGPENISQVPECFVGWMLRDKPQSGEVFEPKTVVDRLDITSPSRMVVPFIIDLQERRMIWVDAEVSGVQRWGSNVVNQRDKIVIVGKAFTKIKKPTLYDLFTLHAQGRGRLVKTPEKADTVFSVENGIQFDLAKISSEFLG
jgi:hypothetical protein